jgi:hypothetical protein
MNASEYLNYKKKQCSKTIARNQCIDAGLRTNMLAKATNTYFLSKSSLITIKNTGFAGDDVTPVAATLRCGPTCDTMNDRYTTPFITVSGCPITYLSTTYVSPCKVEPYQSTRLDTLRIINSYDCTSDCINKLQNV